MTQALRPPLPLLLRMLSRRLVILMAWARAKICAGLYQNNGTGRDTFINMYRKGSGRTSEPGGYQGNCGFYGAGITRFSGYTPYVEPEESVDTKPYSCHKELRPTTSPGSPAGGSLPVPQRCRWPGRPASRCASSLPGVFRRGYTR